MGTLTPKLSLLKPAPGDAASTYDTEFPANMDTLDNAVVTTSTPAIGHILYYNGSAWVSLAPGTAGQVLQANGAAAPTWVSPGAITHPDMLAHDYLR